MYLLFSAMIFILVDESVAGPMAAQLGGGGGGGGERGRFGEKQKRKKASNLQAEGLSSPYYLERLVDKG